MNQPTHALFVISNWDGEGDRLWTFAYQKECVWYHYENDRVVLEYVGDEILQTVILKLGIHR